MFVSARWCVCVCAWVCVFKCALVQVPVCVCVPVCACVKSVRASVIQSGSLIVAEALFVLSVPSLLYRPLLQSSVLLHAPPCLSDRHTDGPRTTKDFLFLHLLFSVACPTLVLFYNPPSPGRVFDVRGAAGAWALIERFAAWSRGGAAVAVALLKVSGQPQPPPPPPRPRTRGAWPPAMTLPESGPDRTTGLGGRVTPKWVILCHCSIVCAVTYSAIRLQSLL